MVTASCNFNCYFCLNEYFGGKSKDTSLSPQNYLDLVRIGDNAFNIRDITITGGEPLIRSDFHEIVTSLKENGSRKITVVTNGSLLTQNIDSLVYTDELHVSFHTFDDNEWGRITRNNRSRQLVEDNIRAVRSRYPELRIKLNVVSEQANNAMSSIERYIAFSKECALEINVFKEGYLRIAEVLGIDLDYIIEPAPMWNLDPFPASLVGISPRKKTYMVDGVRISLSNTSTDEESWDSIWVGPTGIAYCNVFHDTPAIILTELLHTRNEDILRSCLESLISESLLNLSINGNHTEGKLRDIQEKLAQVIKLRETRLPTINLKSYAAAREGV